MSKFQRPDPDKNNTQGFVSLLEEHRELFRGADKARQVLDPVPRIVEVIDLTLAEQEDPSVYIG